MTQVRRRGSRLFLAGLATALVAPVLGTTGVASASDGGAIEAYWQSRGGSASSLGAPVSALTCDSLGCERTFTTGAVVWTATRGAKAVEGELYSTWLTAGGRTGTLGLPTAEMDCTLRDAGCGQPFVKGAAYWSSGSGAHVVEGAILTRWRALGAENSPLGYPTSSEQAVTGGVRAAFQGGTVYWSPATGARTVRTAILAHYESLGGPTALGFPVSDYEPLAGGGERVRFQRGHIYSTAGTGAHVVEGAVLSVYNAQGAQVGPLGYPLSGEEAVAGGVRARFEKGNIYWSGPTGARVVLDVADYDVVSGLRLPSVLTKYESVGGPAQLGFPVADSGPTPDGHGTTVRLQRGTIYRSSRHSPYVVEGAILARYRELGATAGFLGFPRTDEEAVAGGVVSHFTHSGIYWSPATGARLVTGDIYSRYVVGGGPAAMGFPVADEARTPDGGAMLRTQRGTMYWSPPTGAHFVEGAVLSRWLGEGGPTGRLGYPTSSEEAVAGGVRARFQGGTIFWSPTTGTHIVTGAILQRYNILGGPAGLGFPIADEARTADGTGALVRLQRGVIYWSPRSGAHPVEGAILDRWRSLGAHTGSLGYPLSGEEPVETGVRARFQGGTVYWSAATGARVVKGAIRQKYEAAGGPIALGFPTTDERPAVGGAVSDFEDGAIYWSPRTGAYIVAGETLFHWRELGAERGPLGYPVSDPEPHVDGIETGFERGSMIEHPDGSVTVYYGF